MAKIPRWRGSTDLTEVPDSPEWDFGTQQVTCTRVFEGPYEKCLSGRPVIGQFMEGLLPAIPVESVKVKRMPGGKGRMTVTLQSQKPADGDTQFAEAFQPQYEVEMAQIERPVEQHPKFKLLFPDPAGTTAFSAAQVQALAAFTLWESTTEVSAKVAAYIALSDDFKLLARKKMRGQTTYLCFAPVARITALSRTVGRTAACGQVSATLADFGDALPAGFKYLSTADRATRTGIAGKWQSVREWTGAQDWDADFYPPTGGGVTPP